MAKPYTLAPGAWAKHLRKRGKRAFWHSERLAADNQMMVEPFGTGARRPPRRKPFIVEYRYIGEKRWPGQDDRWRPYGKYSRLKDARECLRSLAKNRNPFDEREFRLQPDSATQSVEACT